MKKIILSGKSGFIGNHIFEELMKFEYPVENVDLRKPKEDLENNYRKKNFDVFIHAAGVHPHRTELKNINTFWKSKELLKKVEPIFANSKKVILISSFVNLINYNEEKISETNRIRFNKNDNFYKKSKVLTEKYFKMLNKKFK